MSQTLGVGQGGQAQKRNRERKHHRWNARVTHAEWDKNVFCMCIWGNRRTTNWHKNAIAPKHNTKTQQHTGTQARKWARAGRARVKDEKCSTSAHFMAPDHNTAVSFDCSLGIWEHSHSSNKNERQSHKVLKYGYQSNSTATRGC